VTARTDAAGYFQVDVAGVNPGAFVALKNAAAGSPSSLCQVSSRDNDAWPKAFLLDGPAPIARDLIDAPGMARWYKFTVTPGQRIDLKLSGPPADYDLAAFKDIGEAFASQFNPATAERLSSSSSRPSTHRRRSRHRRSRLPRSRRRRSAGRVQPIDVQTRRRSRPSVFQPCRPFSPSTFSPSTSARRPFSPLDVLAVDVQPVDLQPVGRSRSSTFSATEIAQAFSTAQTRSIVAISATAGLSDDRRW
jgi:hypothetical protein